MVTFFFLHIIYTYRYRIYYDISLPSSEIKTKQARNVEIVGLQMGEVVKDLTAGTVGGASQLVFGHPFDTIKVKLQSEAAHLPKYAGAMDAARQTLAAEGPRGFYKGMAAPFATVAAFSAVLFTARGQMEALLRSYQSDDQSPLTVKQQVVCGAGAGAAVSFLACPTELIKCRLQAGSGGGGGAMDLVRQVVEKEGGVRGLFKGMVPTMAREIPGNAAMFGVYEALKQYLGGGEGRCSSSTVVVAGGLSGGVFWASVYPMDVIKSVIQVDDYKHPKFRGSIDALNKILKGQGVGGLYRGFGPAFARSIPATATCFFAYELTRSALG